MTTPHAQRAHIATGYPLEEIQWMIALEEYETQEELIEAIQHSQMLDEAWDYAESTGEPFDHVMGKVLAGF